MFGLFRILALASATCAFADQGRVRYDYLIKEIHDVPHKWTRLGPAPSNAIIELHIVLKQSSWDQLERHLSEVSDPLHVRYGQHLSAEQVNALIQPRKDVLGRVHAWLGDNGLDQHNITHTPAKDWIRLSIPVHHANRLLDTEYSIFEHEDGTRLIRTPQWSLPKHLHEDIEAVQPTNSFFRTTAMRATFRPSSLKIGLADQLDLDLEPMYAGAGRNPPPSSVDQLCNVTAITPQCLRALYGTANYKPSANGKNKVAFCNYLNQTSLNSDMDLFIQRYRPDADGASINVEVVNNGANQQTPLTSEQLNANLDAEGNLDGQTLVGITHPVPMYAYNTGGSPPFQPDALTVANTNEPYADWLSYILKKSNSDLPQTISTSYGDDEQTIPESYAKAVCKQFAQLGARGVTLLFAAGDNGVGADDTCFSNDGKKTPMFLPSFPASCPYVTVVGGTKDVKPEVAAFDPRNNFASGGGFSNYFSRPSYQDQVVSRYAKSLPSNFSSWYNHNGRAYPDVAAQSQNFVVVWNGKNIQLDGTSASTPTMAGVVSLVNDALIAKGKSPLGFMNPWLYSVGYHAFTDITSGSSVGCNSSGFPAKEGWDAVTGFGTPDFSKMRELATNPAAGFISRGGLSFGRGW